MERETTRDGNSPSIFGRLVPSSTQADAQAVRRDRLDAGNRGRQGRDADVDPPGRVDCRGSEPEGLCSGPAQILGTLAQSFRRSAVRICHRVPDQAGCPASTRVDPEAL